MARKKSKFRKRRQKSEFDQKLVDIRRVTRVVAGGRRMRFRVTMVIGDRKRRVGVGTSKGNDVSSAIEKAILQAKKNLVTVPITENGTIPHEMFIKKGSARLFLKPAFPGTGIIAGSSVRPVLELAGVKNVFTKIYGTNNKLNNVTAAIQALSEMRQPEEMFAKRGVKVDKKEKKDEVAKKEVKKPAPKKEKAEKKTTPKKETAKKPTAKKTVKKEKK